MKILISLSFFLFTSIALSGPKQVIFDHDIKDVRGQNLSLKKFEGKAILLVNIATRCGHTPQLDSLEKLYSKYKDKGLIILGIPSNDFGSQTPENGENIAKFCKLNYGVTFPITEKYEVSGAGANPFIKFVLSQFNDKSIAWNFEKFLFDKKGKPLARYSSDELPLGSSLEKAIQKELNN